MNLNSNTKLTAGLIIIALAIAAVVVGPLVTIWAVNTLFGLTIPFTLETWFATLIMGAFVRGESILTFKK